MRKVFGIKALGLAVSMVALVGTVAMASGATGAYFSDSENGKLEGAAASVAVAAGANADFGGGLNFNWPAMVPGQVYTARAYYTNNGDVPQDISLVFPNRTALSALNSLGAYGAVEIYDSSAGQVFYSNNLIDHPHDVQGAAGLDGRGFLKKLPEIVPVRSGLPVGASGYVEFKFQYASKMTTGGFKFNSYPQPYSGGPTTDLALMADGHQSGQVIIIAADGTGEGLPFQIVATQVGKTPGQAGTWAGFGL